MKPSQAIPKVQGGQALDNFWGGLASPSLTQTPPMRDPREKKQLTGVQLGSLENTHNFMAIYNF